MKYAYILNNPTELKALKRCVHAGERTFVPMRLVDALGGFK